MPFFGSDIMRNIFYDYDNKNTLKQIKQKLNKTAISVNLTNSSTFAMNGSTYIKKH